MKFTPEVIAALQVLRDHAENDFERHRLDVLERDLTSPPKVEIIDDTHQRFNGVVYRKQASSRYAITKQIHRDVWQYYHGEIPITYEIHHLDSNPQNNSVNNLRCLSAEEHHRLHLPKGTQIPRTKTIYTCKECGKEYSTFQRHDALFCSQQCRDKHHYTHNREIRLCKFCGKPFSVWRHNKNQFCSRQCGYQFKIQSNIETRTCLWCGQSFEVRKTLKKKYCSKSCANYAQQANKKKN